MASRTHCDAMHRLVATPAFEEQRALYALWSGRCHTHSGPKRHHRATHRGIGHGDASRGWYFRPDGVTTPGVPPGFLKISERMFTIVRIFVNMREHILYMRISPLARGQIAVNFE